MSELEKNGQNCRKCLCFSDNKLREKCLKSNCTKTLKSTPLAAFEEIFVRKENSWETLLNAISETKSAAYEIFHAMKLKEAAFERLKEIQTEEDTEPQLTSKYERSEEKLAWTKLQSARNEETLAIHGLQAAASKQAAAVLDFFSVEKNEKFAFLTAEAIDCKETAMETANDAVEAVEMEVTNDAIDAEVIEMVNANDVTLASPVEPFGYDTVSSTVTKGDEAEKRVEWTNQDLRQ